MSYFTTMLSLAVAGFCLPAFADPRARLSRSTRSSASHAAFKDERFTVEPGEVVVFAGQESSVREAKSGTLESLLAGHFKKEAPRFRCMAWEADTVYGQWRVR